MHSFTRRFGVALLVASFVFTAVTASAASLNMTAPSVLGADQQTISAPCTSVNVTLTTNFRSGAYYVDAVILDGLGCTGTALTVKVRLVTGGSSTEFTAGPVAGTDINSADAGPLTVDTSGSNITASSVTGIAVLMTGS